MNSAITPKTIAISFFVVVALYAGAFLGLEHLRHRKGPWEVAFRSDAQGNPVLAISQSALQLTNVQLVLHGETASNTTGVVRFDRVQQRALFGQVIYEDLTFLPGVVTFNVFGHEIELLSRVLIADRRVVEWKSGLILDLWPTNKPATPLTAPKRRR